MDALFNLLLFCIQICLMVQRRVSSSVKFVIVYCCCGTADVSVVVVSCRMGVGRVWVG